MDLQNWKIYHKLYLPKQSFKFFFLFYLKLLCFAYLQIILSGGRNSV